MSLPYSVDFIRNMEEGAFVVNRERQILLWNRRAEELTGTPEKQLIGKSCVKYLKCHVNASGMAIEEEDCPLKRALVTGKPQEAALFIKHTNGALMPVNVKVIPYHNQQGFLEGAIELFKPTVTEQWQYSDEVMSERLAFTDPETGLYSRHFLDSYYLRLVREHRAHYDRGLILVDLEVLEELRNLKARMAAFTMHTAVADLLMAIQARDSDSIAARWSDKSFVLLINNSHPVHLQDVVIDLENRLRKTLFSEDRPSIDLSFRLMSTLIAADEPLEKVVDILQKRSQGHSFKR